MKKHFVVLSAILLVSSSVNASPLDQELTKVISRYCDLMHLDGPSDNYSKELNSRWNREDVQALLTPNLRHKGNYGSGVFKECRPVEVKFPFIVVAHTLPAFPDADPNIVRYRAEEIGGQVYIVPFKISGKSVEVYDDDFKSRKKYYQILKAMKPDRADRVPSAPADSRRAASIEDSGDFRMIGDSNTAKGEKREIWGYCNNGASFSGSKWNFDNYWTVSAKTTVSESGLTMDGAVRKACRGN